MQCIIAGLICACQGKGAKQTSPAIAIALLKCPSNLVAHDTRLYVRVAYVNYRELVIDAMTASEVGYQPTPIVTIEHYLVGSLIDAIGL